MLRSLEIISFVTIDHIKIPFNSGLTVISGETGSGKSILINAISLIMGKRSKRNYIKIGNKQAKIIAIFDNNPDIKNFLIDSNIGVVNSSTFEIKRIIDINGNSKSYINNKQCPISLLKSIEPMLAVIHGQNSYLSLVDNRIKLQILDSYCENTNLRHKIANSWENIKNLKKNLVIAEKDNILIENLYKKLSQEDIKLDLLNLKENEWNILNKEYNKLSNIETISNIVHKILYDLKGDKTSLISKINNLSHNTRELIKYEKDLDNIYTEIDSIKISINEVISYFNNYISNINFNENNINVIEKRINIIENTAKLLNIEPCKLYEYHRKIKLELNNLHHKQDISSMINEIKLIEAEYKNYADKLSEIRHKMAKQLSFEINNAMKSLSMQESKFEINIKKHEDSSSGYDAIDFLVSTNVSTDLQPISKIVSGGEMSRIFLAISYVARYINSGELLIFDEIDNGVSGAIAEKIGRMLQDLGKKSQIICITHLPQVAICCNNHLLVTKSVNKNFTSKVVLLDSIEKRIEEIARMLGGIEITDATRKYAKEMINKNTFNIRNK